jgi:RNA polymerase sigma-70 factor (ECF subfamily)
MAGDQHHGKAPLEETSCEEAPTGRTSAAFQRREAVHPPVEDLQTLAQLADGALVERAKQAPEAFGVLYERHVRSIYAFAFSKLHDQSAAEDVTSQAFLQALRALPRYEDRGVPFRAWLFRITANVITDRLRAGKFAESPLPPVHDDPSGSSAVSFDPPDPRSEAEMTAWEHAEDFARLIATLSPEQRTVVRLRFAEGLPIADIAKEMARSEGAIKMMLMRALQNLRKRMPAETAYE